MTKWTSDVLISQGITDHMISDGDTLVARVFDTDTLEGKANLALILAGPGRAEWIEELLAACRAAAYTLSHLEDVCDIDNGYEIKRLKKAIEKANK